LAAGVVTRRLRMEQLEQTGGVKGRGGNPLFPAGNPGRLLWRESDQSSSTRYCKNFMQRFSGGDGGKNRGFVESDDPRELKRRENRALADFVFGRLRCCECDMVARATRFWRAYLTEDEPPQVVVYCPTCALREVGG
jgi:hypothetical protein